MRVLSSRNSQILLSSLLAIALSSSRDVLAAPILFSATGTNAAAIQGSVDAFRNSLGTLNPNVAGSFGSGRREINWDGVPDNFAAPNNLPANFFNSNSPRGVVFSTPGTGFQVSANAVNPTNTPVEFGNINPNYPAIFAPFSAQKLFAPLGSNITDVNFFVPGSTSPAFVSGFGAVFSHVDLANVTSVEFFNQSNTSLGSFFVPSTSGNETFSFLGVSFTEGSVVSRVRITTGNQALSSSGSISGVTVMDDFIYAEPSTVPEPASMALVGIGLAGVSLLSRRHRRRVQVG